MSSGVQLQEVAPKLVVCYNRDDQRLVDEIARSLTELGASVWFDRHIGPSENWRQAVIDAISESDGVVVVLSAAAMNSKEVPLEVQFAMDNDRPIFGIRVESFSTKRPLWFQLRLTNLLEGYDAAGRVAACTRIMAYVSPQTAAEPVQAEFEGSGLRHAECPYRGPLPFTQEESDLFCGRRDEADTVLKIVEGQQFRLIQIYGPSGTGKTSFLAAKLVPLLNKSGFYTPSPIRFNEPLLRGAGSTQDDVYVLQQITDANRPSVIGLRELRAFLSEKKEQLAQSARGTVLIFDQFEELFNYDYLSGLETHCFLELRHALHDFARLRIILVFREEYRGRIGRSYEGKTDGLEGPAVPPFADVVLRRMSEKEAFDAICEPARKKGVLFDPGLAAKIAFELRKVKVLESGTITQKDIKEDIEPVHLQIVCRDIWNQMPEGRKRIDGHELMSAMRGKQFQNSTRIDGVDSLLFSLISDVLLNFYKEVMEKVQKAAKAANESYPDKLVRIGCLQFVTAKGHRVLIRRDELGRVGRLPFWVVRELENEHFLHADQRGAATWYELAHDRLVEPILQMKDEDKEAQQLLFAVESLSAAMKRLRHESGFQGVFEEHNSILRGLSELQKHGGLFEDEAEFVFRSALRAGVHRKDSLTEEKELASLEAWGRVLVAVSKIATFESIMQDALSSNALARVRYSAISLLRMEHFQNYLSPELHRLIREAALTAESEELQEAASVAVCELSQPVGGIELFTFLKDGKLGDAARRALGWVRHAADRREIKSVEARQAFESNWRTVSSFDKLRILSNLWAERTMQSFGWMAFVVAVSAVMTALFAGLAFIPMGHLGAAVTLGTPGAAKGWFHGIAGGMFWGVGISAALLIYWVILRGGRVAASPKKWIMAGICASIGGFLAGVALSFVLGFVFENKSLYDAGWLSTDSPGVPGPKKMWDMFIQFRHGWITPLFGITVALGVTWSLQTITAERRSEAFFEQYSGAIQRPSQVFSAIYRIALLVLKRSWRILILMILGGVVVYKLLIPGPGVYDDLQQWQKFANAAPLKKGEKPPLPRRPLAPRWARVAGMTFIISVGGVFLEVGLLFGIVAARVGVKLERDEHFLRSLPDE